MRHYTLQAPVVQTLDSTIHQAPVVEKVDSAIHRINVYPLDSAIGFANTYPLDSAIGFNTIQYNTITLFKEGSAITYYTFLTYGPHNNP